MFGPGEQVWAPPPTIRGALPGSPIGYEDDPLNYGYGYGLETPSQGAFLEDALGGVKEFFGRPWEFLLPDPENKRRDLPGFPDVGKGAQEFFGRPWDYLLPDPEGKRPDLRNPLEVFFEPGMEFGERRRAERAAEGYAPDGRPIVDTNALLWDLNSPYRQRVEAAGGKPFEGPVDWGGIWAALNGEDAATRDAATREANLRKVSDSTGTGAQWAELMDFATRDARLAANPEIGRGELTYGTDVETALAALAAESGKYGKAGDQIGQTMGGIDALLTAYAPESQVPLPRTRPGYAPSSMDIAAIEAAAKGEPVEITVPYGPEDALRLPGQVEGALPQRPGGPETKEPTVWDNVVDMGGKLLENTTIGGIVHGLFPDIWADAGEAMKGIGSGMGGAQSNRPGDAFWEFQHQGSLSEPVDSGGGYYGGAPVVPPPVVPPFPDANHNGIDDRLEGGTTNQYDRFGQVVFPDMPPYNPGRDNEWLYFRKRAGLRDGGIVGYADGGMVEPNPLLAAPGNDLNMADPRVEVIAKAEDALENALEGTPEPDDEADVAAFVEMFGAGALERLKENVQGGMKIRPGKGRMVQGPGGPRDDAVPAIVDGNQPVALSNGEFIISADAVEGAGDGDPMRGAEMLTELSDRLANRSKVA